MKEDQQIEWKTSWRDSYLKWICGFANAEGGVLVVGRDDKGKVVGVKDAGKLLVDIPNKVRDILGIMVGVNLLQENGEELIEIRVDPYPSPVSYKGEYYTRSGSTNQMLKGAALDRFLLRKQGLHWDGVPLPGLDIASCAKEAFQIFRQEAAQSGRVDEAVLRDSDKALLENLQLIEGRYLKRAAALLFAKKPEKFVSGAYVKIGFFVTDDDLRYQDEVHGSLFTQVETVMELLQVKYLKAYIRYVGIHRREEYLFPMPAVREALLNALAHKDYGSAVPIQISVYDHQLVIWNPGHLPENWTLEKLLGKHPSLPFNPLIANAFFRAGYIESWGRGIEKIQRECREYDVPAPEFDHGMSGLMLTFHANPQRLKEVLGEREPLGDRHDVGKGAPVETSVKTPVETPDRIIELLRTAPHMTLAEVAAEVGKSLRSVERATAKLTDEGRLRHVGPRKGGHWETPVETSVKTPVETSVKTPVKTSVKIIELLGNHPEMTLAELASEIGRSTRAVELAASKLVKEGRLRYVGPQKGGHWEVLE